MARRIQQPDVIDKLQRRMTPVAAKAFALALQELQARVPLKEIVRAFEGKASLDAVLAPLGQALPRARRVLEAALQESSFETIQNLADNGIVGDLDLVNERAVSYANARAGQLITAISAETRLGVRALIRDAVRDGGHPFTVAREIKQIVGLHPRQQRAVMNFRIALQGQGLKAAIIAKRVEAYAKKQLLFRAKMIARTEILWATNRGQELAWSAAEREGWLERGRWRREWITAGDPCPLVCQPMNGKLATIEGEWSLPSGRLVTTPTEAHPHCRCTAGLVEVNERGEVA